MSAGEASVSRVGEILADKYRVVRFLGEGGMGTVYEAQHTIVGRRFAVKFLHAELAKDAEILERFRREALAAGALENENIASVIDFGHAADGNPYIVMEFLAGEDLARFLAREGPLPLSRAVNIIIQACRGLDAAHAAGIVHRDLKPENLFVCQRGDGADLIKILDFGIAKLAQTAVDGPAASVTRTGSTMGTPFYMSPEQARGAKDVDHRVDVYGLGVILFQALSGLKPHPGDSYNEILYHILTQPPTPIGTLRSSLPEDLTDILDRALAFDRERRPPTVMALAQELSRHAGRQVTPLRSQFDLRVTRGSDTGPGATHATTPPIGAPGRGHWRPWRLAGAAVVLVAAVAALVPRLRGGASSSENARGGLALDTSGARAIVRGRDGGRVDAGASADADASSSHDARAISADGEPHAARGTVARRQEGVRRDERVDRSAGQAPSGRWGPPRFGTSARVRSEQSLPNRWAGSMNATTVRADRPWTSTRTPRTRSRPRPRVGSRRCWPTRGWRTDGRKWR